MYAVMVDFTVREAADEEATDRLLEALAPHSGAPALSAAGCSPATVSLAFDVDAQDLDSAVGYGLRTARQVLAAAQLLEGSAPYAMSVQTAAEQERRLGVDEEESRAGAEGTAAASSA